VLKVAANHSGKLGRCKSCGAVLQIPGAAEVSAGDEWATVPVQVEDSSLVSTGSSALVHDARREMLVRLLKHELAECGFEADEVAALFPGLGADARGGRSLETDLDLVQKLRFRVERRAEERVRRELTEKIMAVLAAPQAPARKL
jgi:hypothetical protein